jgi:hypothetical protein
MEEAALVDVPQALSTRMLLEHRVRHCSWWIKVLG